MAGCELPSSEAEGTLRATLNFSGVYTMREVSRLFSLGGHVEEPGPPWGDRGMEGRPPVAFPRVRPSEVSGRRAYPVTGGASMIYRPPVSLPFDTQPGVSLSGWAPGQEAVSHTRRSCRREEKADSFASSLLFAVPGPVGDLDQAVFANK